MMSKKILFLLGAFIASIGSAFACSNAFIYNAPYSVVARTMDFPFNTGDTIGYGLKGDVNSAFVNSSVAQPHAASWTNKHDFIGAVFLSGSQIVDGINDAGVYAAYLYLPDFTQYPTYHSNDSRPVLSAQDTVNFVLGMASNVTEAVTLLKQYQLVQGPSKIGNKNGVDIYIAAPCHVILRDRSGHSAVIEWIKGKTIIYDDAGPVLTNSPPYGWQVKNAQRYDYVSANNINVKYDGAYMNGSGFTGLPGDFSPPSRFSRATQVIAHLPKPQNNAIALILALTAIETMEVPIGSSDSPSLWKTISDLKNNDYYFFLMYHLTPEYSVLGAPGVKLNSPSLTQSWKKYNLTETLQQAKTVSNTENGLLHAVLVLPAKNAKLKIISLVNHPTPGPVMATCQTPKRVATTHPLH